MKLNKNILTPEQINALEVLSNSEFISRYYLSGGTALVAFYYSYRYSDDLDFFSEIEVNTDEILTLVKSLKTKLGYLNLDIKSTFNRNLIFLEFNKKYILKLEFTYYPFTRIDKKHKEGKLEVDSVLDIAVNKLFTIYQQPRYRDFTDLYTILQKTELDFYDLIKKAKLKFDWHVDEFQLGKQLTQVSKRHDEPIFVGEFSTNACEKYFLNLAKELGLNFVK